jgi:tripartite-type tricarboxylate transporter receptor subunit TctC
MKIIIVSFLLLFLNLSQAQETIVVVNAQGPSQSMTPQIFAVVDEANKIQNKYKFVMEFKAGGFESIGVREALENPKNRIVTITNSVVEAESRGLVDLNKLEPVFSHGSACWALITNFNEKNLPKEITIGGPAIGGATHLIGLEIGKKLNIPVRYIVYRSNADAFLHMVSDDNSVNFIIERVTSYNQFVTKNPKLQIIGMNCPERHPDLPQIKTLTEQKIAAPYIFHFTMASKEMPRETRENISAIFQKATLNLGKNKLFELGDFISPVFYKQDTTTHYNASISILKSFREKYKAEIKQAAN